jgi:hypothetical protein
MIDSIVLRLHDLKKYDPLIKRLELKRNEGYKLKTGKVEDKELHRLRNAGYSPKQIINYLERNRTGDFIVKLQVMKQVNRSSHYAFTYFPNLTRDFIEFNFSVPKYLYGSNVLQFVLHRGEVHYKLWDNDMFQVNMENTPYYIMKFIGYFFWWEFSWDKIDFRDVEINRIDLCYNQVYKSKEDVKQAFELLKNINKKNSRDEQGTKRVYGSTIMFVTAGYSAKIYHKGPDYKKHELKEHLKINQEKGFQYFQTEKFQAFADRMLRYEITFRAVELNYLYKHNIYRKNCPHFKIDYENYKRIDAAKQRNNRTSEKIGSLPEKEKEPYRKLHPDEMISDNDKKTHKYVSELLSKKPRFMMKADDEYEIPNHITANYISPKAIFTQELIWICLQKLLFFIKDFQIKELPNEEKIELLIDKYNSTHKEKLQKAKMFQMYLLLVQYGSFQLAIKANRYSMATLYRYIEKFKRLGIKGHQIAPSEDYSIPKAPMDFKEYHAYLSSNNLVRNNRLPNDKNLY